MQQRWRSALATRDHTYLVIALSCKRAPSHPPPPRTFGVFLDLNLASTISPISYFDEVPRVSTRWKRPQPPRAHSHALALERAQHARCLLVVFSNYPYICLSLSGPAPRVPSFDSSKRYPVLSLVVISSAALDSSDNCLRFTHSPLL